MKGAKKILFLSNRGLLPVKDGHTRRSFGILEILAKNNHVYFLSLFETPEEVSSKNIKQLNMMCHAVEFFPAPAKNFRTEMLTRLFRSIFSLDPYTIWRHYSGPFLKRVHELILSGRFDLVHCDILPICYTVRLKSTTFRSVTDHDVSYLKCWRMARDERNPFLKTFMFMESWKLKRLERRIFRDVDLGIAVSEMDKTILHALCPEGRFIVVENGVDLENFFPSSGLQEQNKLVWVGGFGHYPNRQAIIYFLKYIFPLLKKEVPDVRIDIVGGGVTNDLRHAAGKDQKVNFTGYVNNILPYLHKAAVFIAPIQSGGGTKLKILEAMAAGKAIVSTTMGCEGIEGMPGVHYLIANDCRCFAREVIRVLNEKDLREKLQHNARRLVESKYNYVKIGEQLNNYYTSM